MVYVVLRDVVHVVAVGVVKGMAERRIVVVVPSMILDCHVMITVLHVLSQVSYTFLIFICFFRVLFTNCNFLFFGVL